MSLPPRAPSRYDEATSLFGSGRMAEAQAALEDCVGEVPDHVGARFGLGVCYDKRGDAARAEALYRSVIALDPSHVNGHLHLAQLMDKQGRTGDGLTEYRAVLSLNASSAVARDRVAALEGATQPLPPQPAAAPTELPPYEAPPPAARTTLAADLDSDEGPGDRLSMAGAVLHRGRRRLLSFGKLWAGLLILLLVPLLGALSRTANSAVRKAGTSQTEYNAVRMFDNVAYYLQYAIAAASIALILAAALGSLTTRYTVRERRVDIAKGVLFRHERFIWLYDINDIQFRRTPMMLLAGTGKLTLMVDEANASEDTAPTLHGFGSARFLRALGEQLQPMVLRERRAMKKQFV